MTTEYSNVEAIARQLPPFAHHMGMRIHGFEDDLPVICYDFNNGVMGRPGFVHGGALSGLLEMAAFSALRVVLANAGRADQMKPVNITIDFMRGGREHTTYALGQVTRLGQRVANVESFAWQMDRRKLIASSRLNFLLRPQSGE
ncbi:PaaI family thioesterase [Parasphingorhabdus sp. DH2-15]|jgi:uncharacterized protein (TIGR00369 family)|uniref:PaaI family thioesterase n=1 Tax=Parasphingorhabdus sp. DH2-15 TaxID=3444112 RepID=UPI003F686C33